MTGGSTLVIAVHPDDETLGCGGTILKLLDSNRQVHLLIITELENTSNSSSKRAIIQHNEINQVIKSYNFTSCTRLGLPPSTLNFDTIPNLVSEIQILLNHWKIETLIIPFMNDAHSDHYFVSRSAISAAKAFRSQHVSKILMMETLSETNFPSNPSHRFEPNYFVDISKYLEKKLNILSLYQSQIGSHPYARSVESIKANAVVHGSSSNLQYAEAFQFVKFIDR